MRFFYDYSVHYYTHQSFIRCCFYKEVESGNIFWNKSNLLSFISHQLAVFANLFYLILIFWLMVDIIII